MGNICRSPTAEGVFRKRAEDAGLAHRLRIDSGGTHGYHIGCEPDARALAAALRRGYDLSRLRARRVVRDDFVRFDFILGMDHENLHALRALRPSDYRGHLGLFLDFAPHLGTREVPDPYYGDGQGFERVLDLVEGASDGLIAHLKGSLPR
jgi:protein-tyrosine phosphatase